MSTRLSVTDRWPNLAWLFRAHQEPYRFRSPDAHLQTSAFLVIFKQNTDFYYLAWLAASSRFRVGATGDHRVLCCALGYVSSPLEPIVRSIKMVEVTK